MEPWQIAALAAGLGSLALILMRGGASRLGPQWPRNLAITLGIIAVLCLLYGVLPAEVLRNFQR